MTSLTRTLVSRTVPVGRERAGRGLAAGAGGGGGGGGGGGMLFERDGCGLAACGAALHIALPGGLADPDAGVIVSGALSAIAVKDDVGVPGTGPIAIGALPFDRHAPASLIVPSVVVGTDGSQAWRTTVGVEGAGVDVDSTDSGVAGAEAAHNLPDAFTLTPTLSHRHWCDLVARAVVDIRAGRLAKVVLAREVIVDANRPIDVGSVVDRLRALYPSCVTFSVGGFVGASPELLVSRRGRVVTSHPLAGTIARSGDPHTDDAAAEAFLASVKDRAEHAFVVEDVADVLGPVCSRLVVPPAPSIVALRNVSHLGTLVEGTLADGGGIDLPSAFTLAAQLHPTAAVGGTPRPAALDWLSAHEELDRGPYAGTVGWVDAAGNGEWMVGIRSAVVSGRRARLFAGVGVVADSDPAAELAETQLKLQALLAAIVRP